MDYNSLAYNIVKTLHVLAIISWMAAMLYLPRLFVYHTDAAVGGEASETFKVMERRLARAIMTPAMLVAFATGLALAGGAGFFRAGWLHGKFALVLGLAAIHGLLVAHMKKLARDERPKPARFYRVLNEVPALLMVGIVALVIIKPF